jgi:hemolysin III
MNGFWWLLSGGIAYTIGAVLYGVAAKFSWRYIHSVFHLFVIIGTLLQAVCVFFYVLV